MTERTLRQCMRLLETVHEENSDRNLHFGEDHVGILKREIVDFIRQRLCTTSLADDENGNSSESFFDRRGNWKPEFRSSLRQPLHLLEREEFWRILRGCRDALPARQADVFVLRGIQGHSTKDICKKLEITPSNLWVLLYRVRHPAAHQTVASGAGTSDRQHTRDGPGAPGPIEGRRQRRRRPAPRRADKSAAFGASVKSITDFGQHFKIGRTS